MRNARRIGVFFTALLSLGFVFAHKALAAPVNCATRYSAPYAVSAPNFPTNTITGLNYPSTTITISGLPTNVGSYKIICAVEGGPDIGGFASHEVTANPAQPDRGSLTWSVPSSCFGVGTALDQKNSYSGYIKIEPVNDPTAACTFHTYTLQSIVGKEIMGGCTFSVKNQTGRTGCFELGDKISVGITGMKDALGNPVSGNFSLLTVGTGTTSVTISNGAIPAFTTPALSSKTSFTVGVASGNLSTIYCRSNPVEVREKNACSATAGNANPNSGPAKPTDAKPVDFDFCKSANSADQGNCNRCMSDKIHMWTAIGCIPTSPEGIVQSLLRVGLSLAGGVVILSVLYGAFLYAVSAGNAKQTETAREVITSAIVGLLFVFFSIIILQFIGMNILNLPQFGTQ